MRTAVSLFASGGIGDLALKGAGWSVLVANELLEDRASVFCANFPETKMLCGDIRKLENEIITKTLKLLNGRELDLIFATPPCQGMSKNGRGKLLRGIRNGLKPKLDERNQLIINAINCIKELKPRLIVFENVAEMESTLIESPEGKLVNVLDWVKISLAPQYEGSWQVVEFADYGVPQRRQRLITIFTRDPILKRELKASGTLLPPRTHAKGTGLFQKKWISVDEAISHLPPLDSKNEKTAKSDIPFHYVPLLDETKYFWVSNTPEGKGAFDNQCINPKCRYQGNLTHKAIHNAEGINQASKETPIRCKKCSELLPRPWVKSDTTVRLMSGFTSAYKRMRGDLPASALTSNLSYACSDQKIHPRQHRVLSLKEAFILHTVDNFDFKWMRIDGKKLTDKSIREIIGESIPPSGLKIIFDYLSDLSTLQITKKTKKQASTVPVITL
jgi:DNA (cytosine-5)-methyltransferase 1